MEWHHTTSPRKKKFKAVHSAGKIMAKVFWDCEGVMLIDVLPSGQTINSDVYVETLKKRFRRVRSHKDVTKVLHHDNARPHVCVPERPSQSFSGLSCLIHLTARIWLLPITIFSDLWKTRGEVWGRRGSDYRSKKVVVTETCRVVPQRHTGSRS
jgi:hypothetical protein